LNVFRVDSCFRRISFCFLRGSFEISYSFRLVSFFALAEMMWRRRPWKMVPSVSSYASTACCGSLNCIKAKPLPLPSLFLRGTCTLNSQQQIHNIVESHKLWECANIRKERHLLKYSPRQPHLLEHQLSLSGCSSLRGRCYFVRTF
jgi:hypothetical protein